MFSPHTWPWLVPPAFRRRWRRYWISDPFFGTLHLAIHHIGRVLPIDWCSAIGASLGFLNWRFFYKADQARIGWVYAALSGAGPDEVSGAVRRLFVGLGRLALEFSTLDRLWARGRIAVAGAEPLLAARREGRSVIVMGLHLSNWETIAPALTGLGLRGFKWFYQPRRNRFINRVLVPARERCGAELLRPGVAAARIARRHLVEERGVLLAFADEERRGRVSAPLFGRPLPPRANLLDIVRLARISGATIIPAYAERLQGARFRVAFLPPVELAPETANADAVLAEDIARLNRTIEPIVLAHLDHWYMLTEETVAITGGDWRPG